MTDASNESNASGNIENLRKIFSKLPIGGSDDKMNEAEELQQESKAYNFNPDDIAPPDVQKRLLEMLAWRDGVFRWITAKIEMIPGLSSLIDELMNALNACMYHLTVSNLKEHWITSNFRRVYCDRSLAYGLWSTHLLVIFTVAHVDITVAYSHTGYERSGRGK